MKKLSLCLGLIVLSLNATAERILPAPGEQLLGVTVDEEGITFQVSSNGCTRKEDFSFNVEEVLEKMGPLLPAYEHHHYITLMRKNNDACEVYVPYGVKFSYTFEELGIEFGKFHINNPIGGDKIVTLP